ncbi:hypothetical protein AURDEDRAFT_165997 [Auricularia subglabra TFB-10046 SS5]|nr:hypothetical protein AURDEDRAFT_165997 [Auricularia subglabra TFB-10046 SS5]
MLPFFPEMRTISARTRVLSRFARPHSAAPAIPVLSLSSILTRPSCRRLHLLRLPLPRILAARLSSPHSVLAAASDSVLSSTAMPRTPSRLKTYVLDHINDDTVCLACHHNYATHSAEPAFNCALCPPGSCTRFALKTANEFVFNCVCSCEHAYSFHELGPSHPPSSLEPTQAQRPAATPAPAIPRPAPAQLSSTPSSTSFTAPPRLPIVAFPEILPSANTAGLTTNQQRTRSAERHGAAARANGGPIARGPVGSRVPPAPAAPHVPPRAATAPYPDSSIRASNAGAAPSTSAVTRRPVGRPPGKTKTKRLLSRIIVLPYDGEERTFVYLDLEDVSFTISQFTPANRSINSTADLYLGKSFAIVMLSFLTPLSPQFPTPFLITHHGSSVVRFPLHSSPPSMSLSPRSICLTTALLSVPSNTPPLRPPTAHLDVPGAQPSAAPFQPP